MLYKYYLLAWSFFVVCLSSTASLSSTDSSVLVVPMSSKINYCWMGMHIDLNATYNDELTIDFFRQSSALHFNITRWRSLRNCSRDAPGAYNNSRSHAATKGMQVDHGHDGTVSYPVWISPNSFISVPLPSISWSGPAKTAMRTYRSLSVLNLLRG